MYSRRNFITQAAMAAGAVIIGPHITNAAVNNSRHLTILHTNDTHSRIDPFPMDGGRNEGLGGVAARAHLIQAIRKEQENVLLLDAGDIFQGTPYFNIYKGEPEIKAMTAMGYDAVTIGNHDFDAGLQNLATQLSAHASFPVLVSNYNFAHTPMEGNYQPYKIFTKGNIKVGVLGIGIELNGLVPANLYGPTQYLDPIQKANETAAILKGKGCDLIVCLSHLGYQYDNNSVSDIILAKETENIDVIIGGHTHTFLEAPHIVKNKLGEEVVINQVGWAGLRLGRLDFFFEGNKRKKLVHSRVLSVSKISD